MRKEALNTWRWELRAADGPGYMFGQMAITIVSLNDFPRGKLERKLGRLIGWGVGLWGWWAGGHGSESSTINEGSD